MITVVMRNASALVEMTTQDGVPSAVPLPAMVYAFGGEAGRASVLFALTVRNMAATYAKTRLTGPQPVK